MSVDMTPLEIIGLKSNLQATVHTLQDLCSVQIDELDSLLGSPARPLTIDSETLRVQEELKSLMARVDGLLETFGGYIVPPLSAPRLREGGFAGVGRAIHPAPLRDDGAVLGATEYRPGDRLAEIRDRVAELTPKVQSLISHREALQAELDALPRYEATLRKILPIVPRSAHEPGNVCVGVLVSRAHMDVLDMVGKQVLERTGGRAEVAAGDVDGSTRALLLVFPSDFTREIEALLSREDVSRLRLPAELGQGPPDVALAALHRRLVNIPKEIEATDHELSALAVQTCGKLAFFRSALRDELEALGVLSRFGETDTTFVLMGWVPARDVESVALALGERVGETVLMRKLPLTPELEKRAPVILHNPSLSQPFESLVRLLSLPRYGEIDPTQLMALFMPFFFGIMLGDVGYGVLLLALTLGTLCKFKTGILHDILIILALGAGWSIVFGFLFGEAFGTLGENLGMHPLWFDRASPEHVGAFLLLALAAGAVHITLGLFLGIWEAVKSKSRGRFLERGGMLLGLISLFLIVAVLAERMPQGFMTPAIAGLIIGIVLLSVPMGWVGLLLGPVEFIGLIGNLLSYLRISAIGLASIYLAQVANEMAGNVGSLIIGVIVAVLLHALNLVMGAFSPTIHSLRLHYVEFFREFYQGGGKPFEPFGTELRSSVGSQGSH